MFVTYIYDGTFEGFLTVLEIVLKDAKEVVAIQKETPEQIDLFTEVVRIETDTTVAANLFLKLETLVSQTILQEIGYCFLSEATEVEKVLADYICLLVRSDGKEAANYAEPVVLTFQQIYMRVNHEIMRFQGFVRFRKLANGVYYAPIEPDHNVVQFLAPHFSARFADQKWLIHDVKRNSGIYYDGYHCVYIPWVKNVPGLAPSNLPTGQELIPIFYDTEESEVQDLWNVYFKKIAITERQNKRAQRQRMPERYWRYLVEKVEP